MEEGEKVWKVDEGEKVKKVEKIENMDEGLKNMLDQIERAFEAESPLCGIMATLALIDICGAVDSENGEASSHKFGIWYDTYLAPKYHAKFGEHSIGLNKAELYRLRCSLLHQGHTRLSSPKDISSPEYHLAVFTYKGVGIHNCLSKANGRHVYYLDARKFFNDVRESVNEWYMEREQELSVKNNLTNLIGFKTQDPGFLVGGGAFFLY